MTFATLAFADAALTCVKIADVPTVLSFNREASQ